MIEELCHRYGPGLLPDQVAGSSAYNLRHVRLLRVRDYFLQEHSEGDDEET